MIKEGIVQEDKEKTEKKFNLLDTYKDKEWDDELMELFYRDPTIWAYAFLRDKQNKPLKLRPYQDIIVNDKNQFIQVVAANQIGKTWAICVKALHHATFVDNATVLIGSRSEQQAVRVLDEIKQMMKRSHVNFDEIQDEVKNRKELHITNVDRKGISKIVCVPATEIGLGYDATLVLLDELAFWENGTYLYNQVFETRILETQNWKHPVFTMGQIITISNPNGQQGIYWELWHDKRFNHYRFDFLCHPDNTIERWNNDRERMSIDEFDSTRAAVFSSAGGGFVTKAEYETAVKDYPLALPLTSNIFLGGDFAGFDNTSRSTDSSVIYGVILLKEEGKPDKVKVIYRVAYLPNTEKYIILDDIARLFKNYPISLFCYDKMGVGSGIKEDLTKVYHIPESSIEVLTYSLPNKSEVYYNLKFLYEQNRIIHPDIRELKEQILALKFEKTERGCIKVHHLDKPDSLRGLKVHDDEPDAFANACFAAIRLSSPTASVVFIPRDNVMLDSKEHVSGSLEYCEVCEDYFYGGCKEHSTG